MNKLFTILLPVLLVVFGTTAWAEGETDNIVKGKHWVGSSLEQKRAFLFGIGNVLVIERAMAGDDYETMRGRSIVPVLLEGMSGTPIADIVTQLDKYYAEHTDQINRPVIEVIYIEMALPNMQKMKE